ncbi:MAG: WecB/TagA/CpsF family glycosyltransferase [Anaerolineales bacterium]
MTLPAGDILGVRVHALTMPLALETIAAWIAHRSPHYVCVTPAHAVMAYRRDPALLRIANNSGLTTPDGMAIVWLLRWMGFPGVQRVYGPDLLLAACAYGLSCNWRHYFYGGAPGVPEALAQRLQARFPGLQVAGTYSPPFRPLMPAEDAEIVARIRAAAPDILWVGLGTPNQERWMAEHLAALEVPALIGVGAAFDFLSGRKPQAPRWMQRSGLEWLFRLATEPRRLWRRYAEYPWFAALVAWQFLRRGRQ